MNWNHPLVPILAATVLGLLLWGMKQFVDSRVRTKTSELWVAVREVERKRAITSNQLKVLAGRHEMLRNSYLRFKSNFRSKGYVYNPDGSPLNVNEDDEEVE